jgi:hypothetical protein
LRSYELRRTLSEKLAIKTLASLYTDAQPKPPARNHGRVWATPPNNRVASHGAAPPHSHRGLILDRVPSVCGRHRKRIRHILMAAAPIPPAFRESQRSGLRRGDGERDSARRAARRNREASGLHNGPTVAASQAAITTEPLSSNGAPPGSVATIGEPLSMLPGPSLNQPPGHPLLGRREPKPRYRCRQARSGPDRTWLTDGAAARSVGTARRPGWPRSRRHGRPPRPAPGSRRTGAAPPRTTP